MHQTFQEYLAARHLRLVRPGDEAVERILAVAPDLRWHEVVRLAAGFIGVIQEDEDKVSKLVLALAEDERDPLEPYLCSSLRLAASCVADGVGMGQRETQRVVVKMCERLGSLSYQPVVDRLALSFQSMQGFVPDAAAVRALLNLTKHEFWLVRMEAARILGWVAARNPEVCECFRNLLSQERDDDVRAHAALGLWRAGERGNYAVDRAILPDLSGPDAKMERPGPEFVQALVRLLEDDGEWIQLRAAEALGTWGSQAEAIPALIRLLKSDQPWIRLVAAEAIGEMGGQEKATPILTRLVEDDDPDVRMRAAAALGKTNSQAEAVPALVYLLERDDGFVRSRAAEALGKLGSKAEAIPALIKCLNDKHAYVRLNASTALRRLGAHSEPTEALIKLLKDNDPYIRWRAAKEFGIMGLQAEAAPAPRSSPCT